MTKQEKFRIGRVSDAPFLMPLMEEYYRHDRLPFDSDRMQGALERLLSDASLGRVWVVEYGESGQSIESGPSLIGYLALTFGFTLEAAGREAYVDEFFIRAENRGQGLGEKLLKQVMELCPSLEVKLLRLEVTSHNDQASRLYKRLGFVDWGRSLLAYETAK